MRSCELKHRRTTIPQPFKMQESVQHLRVFSQNSRHDSLSNLAVLTPNRYCQLTLYLVQNLGCRMTRLEPAYGKGGNSRIQQGK